MSLTVSQLRDPGFQKNLRVSLKEAMDASGATHRRMAERLGISSATVWSLLSGKPVSAKSAQAVYDYIKLGRRGPSISPRAKGVTRIQRLLTKAREGGFEDFEIADAANLSTTTIRNVRKYGTSNLKMNSPPRAATLRKIRHGVSFLMNGSHHDFQDMGIQRGEWHEERKTKGRAPMSAAFDDLRAALELAVEALGKLCRE